VPLVTLKRRAEFLRVRGGARWATASCVVETVPAAAGMTPDASTAGPVPSPPPPRFGFTVTRKLGKAVVRNRIRRRLKAAVAALNKVSGGKGPRPGFDYVLIARPAAETRSFAEIVKDLDQAFYRVHHPRAPGRRER